jgi:hypothetical protein
MTKVAEATGKDFEQMMQMLTGFCVTQIAGAVASCSMHGFTAGVAQDVTRLVDASAAKLAVDIGGASGTLVHSLMSANPQLRGIILDLPDVVPSATNGSFSQSWRLFSTAVPDSKETPIWLSLRPNTPRASVTSGT